ncbi:HlyD family type I secretion periplasmic adaptor subunit [Phenylobacterium hankyongense]|uniref:Membrane fusion protein (MFP) family protein n=2 Tax=Phenylobacterium hankyongense TaxID=1813876 RepID=A0A328B763_9CAUL|nr:HlyD family type I secretion periplasmic adaptor subunit [Phenylobacterium hankyongense]
MVVGAAIIGTLVVGLGLWASLTPLSTGVTAPAEVRVEANRKTLRHREGGTVRQILVREGQHVTAGQPLILFDDVEARASNDVFQNQADSMMSQAARLTAEATNRPNLEFPPELTSRISDPRVASMIRDQQFLFATRLQLFQSQGSVLDQRLDQIRNQIVGNQAQVASVDEQRKLTAEEMAGYQTLYEKGFAPKPLILRYQRSIADLDGRKGSLLADIARLHQQMGETNMNLATLRDQRQSQAAEQLRDTQSKIADVMPRLAAAKQTLASTVVRSPVDGYVFNLTQFTLGGVTSPGEVLMDVVPANSPLMVTATIKPEDIEEVHVGMDARVRITGLNQRWVSPLPAKVAVVSADRITNEKTGLAFYRVDLRIDPKELTNLKRGAQVTPGMGAQAMIVTGKRTIMGFLISPITDTLHDAFREQ